MRRSTLGVGIAIAATAVAAGMDRDAAACGGCFHPPTPPTQMASDITDERMLLAVSPTQTTLYDQIRYAGTPSSFAWVLPIRGTVTVGLSADVLFDSFDALTRTQIVAPASRCPAAPSCGGSIGCGGSASDSAFASANGGSGEGHGVTVTKQQNVGPYDTVQLHATDSRALSNWLGQNSFVIPADVTPVLDAYVREGFDFLAMKLLPDQGVQAMRPVRVSSAGASLSLPLRMAAVGTGVTVGITIWVVSDGRYEPQNFPFYRIDDGALVWDWAKGASNYTSLRAANEAALDGRGWEIESSLTLNQTIIANAILSGGAALGNSGNVSFASDPAEDYLAVGDPNQAAVPSGTAVALDAGGEAASAPEAGREPASALEASAASAPAVSGDAASIDAIDASHADEGSDTSDGSSAGDGSDATEAASAGDVASTSDAVAPARAGDAGGAVPGNPDDANASFMTAAEVRAADIAALFVGLSGPNVRVTRIRGDIAHAAMTADLYLQASADQSELSNVRAVAASVNETCPIYRGCNVVGTGTPEQSAASTKSGGCAASPSSLAASCTGSGAAAGLFALLVARGIRMRRRSSPTRKR